MTGKEMTELFAIMLLAWPNAETFKGGIPKLAPTIKLWVSCTADVDFWTGQQAVVRLCQHCKFPPTIAEFREQVDNVNKDIDTVGGVDALSRTWTDNSGKECSMWKLREIEDACRIVIRGRPAMVGGELPALNAKNGR